MRRSLTGSAAIVERAQWRWRAARSTLLGPLMNANQDVLRRLDVSGPELEALIEAALRAGASGAKLSGGGRGGNVIAVIQPGAGGTGSSTRCWRQARSNVIVTRVG